jgi:hypothetical protein
MLRSSWLLRDLCHLACAPQKYILCLTKKDYFRCSKAQTLGIEPEKRKKMYFVRLI